MRARARPLFLGTLFQILLRISQSTGKNENPKKDILALKSFFGFRVRLEIRNPDFPIERTHRIAMILTIKVPVIDRLGETELSLSNV